MKQRSKSLAIPALVALFAAAGGWYAGHNAGEAEAVKSATKTTHPAAPVAPRIVIEQVPTPPVATQTPIEASTVNPDPLATLPDNLAAAYNQNPAATMDALKAFVLEMKAKDPANLANPTANDPDEAARHLVDDVRSGKIPDYATAAKTALDLPPGKDRNDAIVNIAQAWVGQDPGAASEWMASVISTLPVEDKTQEHVIEALLPSAINENPAVAFGWAGAITDDKVRSNRINDVVSAWAQTDPAAAAQAVQSANLSDDLRAQLLAKIQAAANPPAQ